MKWGIVGFGSISKNRFLPALDRTEGSELSAVVTSHPEKAAEALKGRNVRIFDNVAALEGVDAVYIASPNSLHLSQSVACAEMGINVLCEKPAALNARETEAILSAFDKRDLAFGVANMGRFNGYNVGARKIIRSGILGKIEIVKASFSFVNGSKNAWRYDRALSGGGAIMDIGVHLVNSLHFFLEKNVKEVAAINTFLGYEVEQNAAAVMRFGDDSLALVDCSYDAHEEVSFEFRGTEGVMYVRDTLFQDYKGGVIVKKGGRSESMEFPGADPYVLEIKDMEEAVKKGLKPATDGRGALRDMKVIDAWYESSKEGRKAEIRS